jgi:hypothetical protein
MGLRDPQIYCVCHSKIECTVHYLGIEVDDAIRKDRILIREAILRSADVVGDGLRVAHLRSALYRGRRGRVPGRGVRIWGTPGGRSDPKPAVGRLARCAKSRTERRQIVGLAMLFCSRGSFGGIGAFPHSSTPQLRQHARCYRLDIRRPPVGGLAMKATASTIISSASIT